MLELVTCPKKKVNSEVQKHVFDLLRITTAFGLRCGSGCGFLSSMLPDLDLLNRQTTFIGHNGEKPGPVLRGEKCVTQRAKGADHPTLHLSSPVDDVDPCSENANQPTGRACCRGCSRKSATRSMLLDPGPSAIGGLARH